MTRHQITPIASRPPPWTPGFVMLSLGVRKVNTLEGGGEVHLQLVYYAPEQRAFNTIIQSSPLPVRHYVGEVRVTSLDEGRAQLTWRGVFEPAGVSQGEADALLQGFYQAIADRIGERFPRA